MTDSTCGSVLPQDLIIMDDDIAYWLALQKAPGVGNTRFHHLLELLPSIREIFDSPALVKELKLTPHFTDRLITYLQKPAWKEVERELQWAQADDNTILTIHHSQYPALLKTIDSPPVILFVTGQVTTLNAIQLAMVGSRNPSADGSETAFNFARYLAANGMVITSGLALGIDAQCHLGALATNGITIAVAGTGIDRVYPARHKKLAHQLVERGAIISEYPLGCPPAHSNFPRRNRIISGMSVGTLVVEAALKSGSLITAKYALEQGREIFAIPGSIHNPLARGSHSLIKNGAKLVEKAEDILEELSSLMLASQLSDHNQPSTCPSSQSESTKKNIDSLLPKVQQKILKNLGYSPVSINQLQERTGLTIAEINANLVLLEIAEQIQSLPGGKYTLKHTS